MRAEAEGLPAGGGTPEPGSGNVDDDERYWGEGGDGFDDYCIAQKRQEIADQIDADAPGLDPQTHAWLIDLLDEKVEGEEVVTEGDDGPRNDTAGIPM